VKYCYKVVIDWKDGTSSTYFSNQREKDFLVSKLGSKFKVSVIPVKIEYAKTPVLSGKSNIFCE
jgi:hypothetical protein